MSTGFFTIGIGIAGFFASEAILRLLRTPADILPLAAVYFAHVFAHKLGIAGAAYATVLS